jgi:hypothetical protein
MHPLKYRMMKLMLKFLFFVFLLLIYLYLLGLSISLITSLHKEMANKVHFHGKH